MTMSLEDKIGQMIGVGFAGTEPPDYLLEWLAEGRIGTVILFARNVVSPEQVARLTYACHAAAKYPLLICIDQEGGMVARLRDGFTESPGAMALSASGSTELAERMSAVLAAEMRALGINWNLAPVVDVTYSIENPSVGTRSPGADPEQVREVAIAQVRGFQRGGVVATAKHFPGLGNTPVDTHLALAVIDGPLDYLWENDLKAFRGVVEAGVDVVMVSHVKFPALDPEHPATLSRPIIQGLLRDEIGFQGVVCTDCMEMKAIASHYGPGEAAVLAALAGEDIILVSHTPATQMAVYDALLDAARSGRLPLERIDAAVERIQRLKARAVVPEKPQLDLIRQPSHLKTAREAAETGLVLLKRGRGVFPLPPGKEGLTLIEFTSYLDSEVLEQTGQSSFAARLRTIAPDVDALALPPDEISALQRQAARDKAKRAGLLIVATRNAHLLPEQLRLAKELLGLGRPTILICLRNPYDAGLLREADAVLCTLGDSAPSLDAAVSALAGQATPRGRLPVPLPVPEDNSGATPAL